MARSTERRWPAALIAAALALPAHAANVACHLTYGGETRVVSARPTAAPETIAPVAIGSYFLFRIVFRQEPADLAGEVVTLGQHLLDDGSPVITGRDGPAGEGGAGPRGDRGEGSG